MPDLIRAELDRVGASFGKAGAANYIALSHDGDGTVRLFGPPREHPRRRWIGLEAEALGLLDSVPDNAGVDAVWRALGE